MSQSAFARLWNAIKPPPAVPRRAKSKFSAKQKRMLKGTAGAVALVAIGGAVYGYIAGAPDRARAQFDEAMKSMGPGNYPSAIAGFTRAIGTWPGLADAYMQRGSAYRALGQNPRALADFDKAIEVNSNLAEAYSARGSLYRERGDYKKAMEDFTQSLNIAPSVNAYFERGQAYESLGEHRKAIDDFDRALVEMRNSPAVYRARSLAKRNLGDTAGYESDRDTADRIEHRR